MYVVAEACSIRGGHLPATYASNLWRGLSRCNLVVFVVAVGALRKEIIRRIIGSAIEVAGSGGTMKYFKVSFSCHEHCKEEYAGNHLVAWRSLVMDISTVSLHNVAYQRLAPTRKLPCWFAIPLSTIWYCEVCHYVSRVRKNNTAMHRSRSGCIS